MTLGTNLNKQVWVSCVYNAHACDNRHEIRRLKLDFWFSFAILEEFQELSLVILMVEADIKLKKTPSIREGAL